MTRQRILVGSLLALGAFLRLYALDRYPLPVQQDELSNIYDAQSLIDTGADRAGIRIPLVVRGFGESDYRPALMVYLTAIPLRLFGFSPAVGRLAAGTLSTVALLLIFLLARGIANESFAVVALVFATLSPWLILDGRLAHEGASLAPFFVILPLWLWYRAAASGYPLFRTILVGFALGFSANAYQGNRLIGPLLLLLVAIDLFREHRKLDRAMGSLVAAAALGALPQIWVMIDAPERFFARAASTVSRGLERGDPVLELGGSIAANFSPSYLFWPDMREVFLTTARLLPVEFIFFPVGVVVLWQLRDWRVPRFRRYLYIVLIVAVLPAAVTFPNPHSLRAASSALIIPFFSAAGVMTMYALVSSRRWLARLFAIAATAGVAASFCFLAYMYLYSATLRDSRMQNALVRTAIKLKPYLTTHDRVFIADSGMTMPYLYFVAFTGMSPREYQAAPKIMNSVDGWDVARRVGRFYFRSDVDLLDQVIDAGPADLFVTRSALPGSRVLDSLSFNWDHYYIADFPRLRSSEKAQHAKHLGHDAGG